MVFPSTKGRNLEKGEQLASFTQSPGNQMQKIEAEVREPLGNEPRKRALSRNLCCMNNLESHLRLVGLISPYLKLNLAYVVLFFPSMGTLFPRTRTE